MFWCFISEQTGPDFRIPPDICRCSSSLEIPPHLLILHILSVSDHLRRQKAVHPVSCVWICRLWMSSALFYSFLLLLRVTEGKLTSRHLVNHWEAKAAATHQSFWTGSQRKQLDRSQLLTRLLSLMEKSQVPAHVRERNASSKCKKTKKMITSCCWWIEE